jgi:hypothetical protein
MKDKEMSFKELVTELDKKSDFENTKQGGHSND